MTGLLETKLKDLPKWGAANVNMTQAQKSFMGFSSWYKARYFSKGSIMYGSRPFYIQIPFVCPLVSYF